jgi:hypothetical protein
MKKFLIVCATLVMGGFCLSAGIRNIPGLFNRKKPAVTSCVGFTVIEATHGLNCNGDTVRLKKVNGFYAISTTD